MTEQNQIDDLEFNISETMLDPFKGTLQFTVQRKIKIVNFEFSTHEMGCRRMSGRDVKYGLKLKLNKKVLFTYHKSKVDVEVLKKLILTPGNTYTLETWLGGHNKLKPGQVVRSCYYHYAEISQSDNVNYEPFEFVFPDNERVAADSSIRTCLYVISYELMD